MWEGGWWTHSYFCFRWLINLEEKPLCPNCKEIKPKAIWQSVVLTDVRKKCTSKRSQLVPALWANLYTSVLFYFVPWFRKSCPKLLSDLRKCRPSSCASFVALANAIAPPVQVNEHTIFTEPTLLGWYWRWYQMCLGYRFPPPHGIPYFWKQHNGFVGMVQLPHLPFSPV